MVASKALIQSTTDYLVTENRLNPHATAEEIMELLRRWKTTGLISLTTNQGGVQGVLVVERTRMSEEQSAVVRGAMGMVSGQALE